MYSIQQMLGVRSMQGLALRAMRNGLLDVYAAEDEPEEVST